jgi:polyhydroxyalkanoate synthesis regulator phasin
VDRSTTIDNASTDETPALFASDAEFDDPLIHYIRLAKNLGGAGGFKEGMRRAAEAGNDWCWIMDDDVIPEQDALQGLLDAHSYLASKDIAPSYLASCVYGPHGEVMNVIIERFTWWRHSPFGWREGQFADAFGCFGIDVSSSGVQQNHRQTKGDIMAGFDLGEGVRKVFLAGVGAIAMGAEKSQQIIEDLVKKGEDTVAQGKSINEELSRKANKAASETQDSFLRMHLEGMTPEERKAYAQKVADMANDIDQKGKTVEAEVEVVEDGEEEANAAEASEE